MHLLQILLPVRDNDGRPFPPSHYHQVGKELAQEFHGLTAYTRAPAEGLWEDSENTIEKDDIVIFEVMLYELDEAWWRNYKISLQALFSQDEIVIRLQDIRLL